MKKPQKIRILVVDDHFVVRVGLTGSINIEPDMMVVEEASNGAQAIKMFRELQPDIVLIDLRLPDMDGVSVTNEIRKEFPEARVIVLSTYEADEDIFKAMQAGARAYLPKTLNRNELLQAIRTVHAGGSFLPPGIAARLTDRLPRPSLSARELQVLQLIVNGKSNKEIASALNISEITVKFHVGNVLEKLNVSDRTQAATLALKRGLIALS